MNALPSPPGSSSYVVPVGGRLSVLEPFRPPPTPYAAGHRGVDLATSSGRTVVAAGAGTVVFSGRIADRSLVVIRHPDGITTEYEPVKPRVSVGADVAAGELIGIVTGVHRNHPRDSCLHWGARRADQYIDPLKLLQRLGPVRLVPWGLGPGG